MFNIPRAARQLFVGMVFAHQVQRTSSAPVASPETSTEIKPPRRPRHCAEFYLSREHASCTIGMMLTAFMTGRRFTTRKMEDHLRGRGLNPYEIRNRLSDLRAALALSAETLQKRRVKQKDGRALSEFYLAEETIRRLKTRRQILNGGRRHA